MAHGPRALISCAFFDRARLAVLGYGGAMNCTPSDKPVPESIAASLARSEAQIAAGQTVPLEPVLDQLHASIARMQADDANAKPETPPPKG